MNSRIRLVAIDVDGTLLPSAAQQISPRTGEALRAAQRAGLAVVIATGRRTAYTMPLFEPLGLQPDLLLVTSNGAVVRTLGGELIDQSQMSASTARALCGLLRPHGALVFTFDRPGRAELVMEEMERSQGRISIWIEANRHAIEIVNPLELALPEGENPIQGMVTGTVEQMRRAERALKESPLGVECECVRTEYPARDLSILDLLPKGVSKGVALAKVALRLGVEPHEAMAIGDNWNDWAMLEWAGQSLVMGNASAEFREQARIRGWKQLPPNDQDGVAVALERTIAQKASDRS